MPAQLAKRRFGRLGVDDYRHGHAGWRSGPGRSDEPAVGFGSAERADWPMGQRAADGGHVGAHRADAIDVGAGLIEADELADPADRAGGRERTGTGGRIEGEARRLAVEVGSVEQRRAAIGDGADDEDIERRAHPPARATIGS